MAPPPSPTPPPPTTATTKRRPTTKHIQGQASLLGFLTGQKLSALPDTTNDATSSTTSSSASAPPRASRSPRASSGGKRRGRGHPNTDPPRSSAPSSPPSIASPAGSTSPRKQTVTVVKEKISVAGWQPSPTKSSTPTASPPGSKPLSSMPPKSSKYFASSSSASQGKNPQEAIDVDDSSEDDVKPAASKRASGRSPRTSKKSDVAATKRKVMDAVDEDGDDDWAPKKKPAAKAATKSRKGRDDAEDFQDDDDGGDDDEYRALTSKTSASRRKATGAKGASDRGGRDADAVEAEKKVESADAAEMTKAQKQEMLKAALERKKQGQIAPGSKVVPQGTPNCFLGLTFVFTGELESLSREEATDTAKRLGGKVTTAPSSKTSFVVVGEGAGPSKLEKIRKFGLKVIDEDAFLALIEQKSQARPSKEALEAKRKEEEKVRQAAAAMKPNASLSAEDAASALWTVKYAPTQFKELIGNQANVTKMQEWLSAWPSSLKCGFKKPGKHMLGGFRALLLSGPPGIGKTSSAHLVARQAGYIPVELNASDTRSKKLIESSLRDTVNNSSLDAWHKGGRINTSESSDGVKILERTCLIMDEVDGMSGGDRGGVGAIAALIKKTKVPIICIANDVSTPKMKPLANTCGLLKFTRPTAQQIRSRMMTIAYREKLKISAEVVDQLVAAAQADIRLVINMLSTWALSEKSMTFEQGKALGEANRKPGLHTPFSLYGELSRPGTWAKTCKMTLNDKAEFYFNDHSIMPLMVQQNYLKSAPTLANAEADPRKKALVTLQLAAKAASYISDGDVIDGMIHGPQQHWSLMPLHAISSTVAPMSFMHGASTEFAGFPAFLGMNSKAMRLARATVELQAKMRLTASGSRHEIREQYLPYFFTALTEPLIQRDKDGIDEVIRTMDEYMLGLEDRDAIVELGVAPNDGDKALAKIKSQTKAGFTRAYRASDHPVAFYKPSELGGGQARKPTLLRGDAAPDVEEAIEVDDDVGGGEDDEAAGGASDDEGANDLSKNRMVKLKKSKGKGK